MPVAGSEEILVDLGREARARREEANLSLEDVYERTRIRIEFLEGIERGNYEGFPDLVYVKGFVRTYLGVIGAEDLKNEFQSSLNQKAKEPNGPLPPTNVLGNGTSPTKGFKPASRLWLFLILFMILIGTGGYVWYSWSSNFTWDEFRRNFGVSVRGGGANAFVSPDNSSEDVPLFASQDTPPLSIVPVSASPVVEVPPEPEPMKPYLLIKTHGDVWTKVTIGDKVVLSRTLKGSTVVSWDLTAPARVTYGRPNMASVELNGKDLGIVNSRGARTSETYIYEPDGKYRKAQ